MKIPQLLQRKKKKTGPAPEKPVLKLDPNHQEILHEGKLRAVGLGKFLGLAVLVIVVRLFWLQIVQGSTLAQEANDQITG